MILKVIYDVTFFLQDPVVRTLCLSETCMIERDPATYIIVSCHPLSDVSFKCEVSCHFCDLGTNSSNCWAYILLFACGRIWFYIQPVSFVHIISLFSICSWSWLFWGVNNATHRINLYLVDRAVHFLNLWLPKAMNM